MIKSKLVKLTATLALCLLNFFVSAKEYALTPSDMSAAKKAKAGDILWLSAGIYSQKLLLSNLKGTAAKPIIIQAIPGEKVLFDGTDDLSGDWQVLSADMPEGKMIQEAQWEKLKGKLYCKKLDAPIYGLIYKGRLMSQARWPNARWDDPWRLDRYFVLRRAEDTSIKGTIYDGLSTDNTLEESSKWLHYDRSQCRHRDEMLGDTDISYQGAVAVMSYTWGSWASKVTSHQAGDNDFNYDINFEKSGTIKKEALTFLNKRVGWEKGKGKFRKSGHAGIQFFLMGLPALDIEEEWWYDKKSGVLYFISPQGENPDKGQIRGKRRDYIFEARHCQYLHIKGI
ncbi:hypothetical protein [Carboxylicivirga marina]|uniref:Fibrobacter succinogenes major paralogous domain-containing protein n=1 Tax=Carboxylicivirga marina TaxID=2800988 RepID=A0ABS1HIL7_9BACT|nr:hypothetical protein [Carboxylicivirga marina]MBK3517506.1 hypothetical protein [Carboxylicivirga marina]